MHEELAFAAMMWIGSIAVVVGIAGGVVSLLPARYAIFFVLFGVTGIATGYAFAAGKENKEWEDFAAKNNCVIIKKTDGTPAQSFFDSAIPPKTTYRCANGVTYEKNH